MQLDASRLDYTHSDHPLISPAIWGNIDIWNKFVRRWDLGAFCVTRTGYLMQYRHPFGQFEDNIKPKMSIRLATTVLGDLVKAEEKLLSRFPHTNTASKLLLMVQ